MRVGKRRPGELDAVVAGLTQLRPQASTASRVITHALIFVCPGNVYTYKFKSFPESDVRTPW